MNVDDLSSRKSGWRRLSWILLIAGLVLLLIPVVAVAVGGFSDVPSGHAHADGIVWTAENEISVGYTDGTFRPGESVTRGQMATFLHRTADKVGTAAGATVRVPSVLLPSPSGTALDRWFNNVNGQEPTFTRNGSGHYTLDFGFDLSDRFVQVTASPTGLLFVGTPPDVRWATASISGTELTVWTYRWDGGGGQPDVGDANIHVLIY